MCRARQNRAKLIKMWKALEDDETPPQIVGSGILEPGDVVFFNPTHPHRGPSRPFPDRLDAGGRKRQKHAPRTRYVIFMSAVHTRGSSEKHAIFAKKPPPGSQRRGKVWREKAAFGIAASEIE